MRVTLIYNPAAGRQTGGAAQDALAMLRAAGHDARLRSAADAGWTEALKEPADVVAVAGGDGTVTRVAKAMVGRGVPLALLPAGTANNIAHTLGLLGRPWEELVAAWPAARRVKLDVGIARGPWGEKRFVEGVGAGLFACLLGDPDPARELAALKPPDERVAHALQTLKNRAADCAAVPIAARLDGRDISGRYLLFEAVNLRYVGPSLFLAPDSRPGDGNLDVVLVTEAERNRLQNYLSSWQDNRERLPVLPTHQGRHLHMEWGGFEMHIDDELWPPPRGARAASPAAIDLHTGGVAVEVLVPANSRGSQAS